VETRVPRRIVVGIDGSDAAVVALRWAVDEAERWSAHLDVVHAWTIAAPVSPFGFTPTWDPSVFETDAKRLVADAMDVALSGHPGVSTEGHAVRGSRVPVLLSVASKADLLVVGCRGHSSVADFLLGSVSQQCLHHAPCPIAVVRGEAELTDTRGRVVVGVDGSDGSWAALRWAAAEAVNRKATLTVVHAWTLPAAAALDGIVLGDRDEQEFAEAARGMLDEMTDGVVEQLDGRPVAVEKFAVQDAAGPALVHSAHDADVLVVGARGQGGFAGLLVGSVSRYCAHHTRAPIVVVPWHRS